MRWLIQTLVTGRKGRMRARAEYKSQIFTMLGRVHPFSEVPAGGRKIVRH